MSAVSTHRVQTGHVRMHVEERAGDGTPVLVLHGFTGCASTMASVVGPLTRSGRATLTPDLVGHGRSTVDAPPEAFTMAACVDQLTAVLDAVSVDRVHVVGYSMGGRVALSLAAAGSVQVRSLALIGASPGIADPSDRAERRRADDDLATSILTDGIEVFAERWAAQPLFATQPHRLGVEGLAAAHRRRLANDPRGLAASLRGMGSGSMPPLHDRLGHVDAPTLVLAGADDTKFCSIGRSMAAALPEASFVEVPDAGHAAHLENPTAVVGAIAGLLDRTDPLR